MKRPEGFDPPATPAASSSRPVRKPKAPRQKPEPRIEKAPNEKVVREKPVAAEGRVDKPKRRRSGLPRPSRATRPDAGARAELRRAARERRKFERAEVRRFTRRARTRRLAIASVAGLVVTLIGLVLAAVYSPLLALREIVIDGTSRVNAVEVQAALEEQMGTPLALLDFGKIETQLGAFPLIRSYVTETLPPGTLLIHIVERQPMASIQQGSQYLLVDPAGITIQESVERIPGVPLIDLAGADTSSDTFESVVEVLLALPAPLLAQVDTVTARTQDDVRMTFAGVGQQVSWGSADDSAEKAVLLAALIAQIDPGRPGLFDVSAPSNGVFRPF